MPLHLTTTDPDFESAFAAFLAAKREASEDVDQAVRAIIAQVRKDGDTALIELTRRFDRLDLAATGIRVSEAEIAAAVAASDKETMAALELALARIESHHRRQLPADDRYTDALGAELGSRWTAIESVGLYVPGGLASYPSSVLMNAVPARVAGVPRVAMAVPSPGGEHEPAGAGGRAPGRRLRDLSHRRRAGRGRAGLRHRERARRGQDRRPRQRLRRRRQAPGVRLVGIDSIAGPSEVLVIADRDNDPEWLAADLLAQAEHDTAAQAILMTDDAGLAERVKAAVAAPARPAAARQYRRRQLGDLRRRHRAPLPR